MTTQFNELVSRNKALCDDVRDLYLRRTPLSQKKRSLQRALQHQDNLMKDMVEKYATSYDQSSETFAFMLAKKQRSEEDDLKYHIEMRELMRRIAHERKRRNFMMKKAEERKPSGEADEAEKRKREQAQRKTSDGKSVGMYQEVYRLVVEVTNYN